MPRLSTAKPTHLSFPVSFWLIAALLLLAAGPLTASDLPQRVEATHGGEAWDSKQLFQAFIEVEFGGNPLLKGKMTTDTAVGKTRFDLTDGTTLVFDGQDAWKAPADSNFQGTRFHVLTWPYFLAAAMKLDDPGTHIEDLGRMPFHGGRNLPAARLTFGDGVGDSPDDWYILFTHPTLHRLEGMAYIVTFGKDAAEAEKSPSAIVYEGYEDVEGVQVSTAWKFFKWTSEDGILGQQVGEARILQPTFIDFDPELFAVPDGAEKAPAP